MIPKTLAELEAAILVLETSLSQVSAAPMRFKTSKSEYELARNARGDMLAEFERLNAMRDILLYGVGGAERHGC